MKDLKHTVQASPLQLTVLVALIIVFISGALIVASWQGWPRQIFGFTEASHQGLTEGMDIAGWASFDRDSYVVGAPIKYRVRILYRGDQVVPDLDQFVRSLSFSPIEKRESVVTQTTFTEDVNEYTLEYILQGVDVAPHTTYQLDPVVLFYKRADASVRELQSLRIQTPTVFFTEYYPSDVSKIPLKGLKGQINDAYGLRQGVMGACGALLLALSLFIVWRYGRKRTQQELSETEKLWQEFHAVDGASLGYRHYLLKCEKIITRLFQSRASLSPGAFWLGRDPEAGYWKDLTIKVRQVLNKIYRPSELGQTDVDQISGVLNATFATIVAEDRLKREAEPSFINRLKQQPKILVTSVICLGLAVFMFSLVAQPGLWLSPDLIYYNDTVKVLSSAPLIEESVPLAELGKQSEDEIIKAAAFYNAGTIKAHIRPSTEPALQEQELLEVVFQPELQLDSYIDNEASLAMLFASAGWLREAKEHLQEAVRFAPYDDDVIRNLELASKRHAAVVAAINSIFQSQGPVDMKGKSKLEIMVDVLNLEWPEETEEKEEEDKKSQTHKISERF